MLEKFGILSLAITGVIIASGCGGNAPQSAADAQACLRGESAGITLDPATAAVSADDAKGFYVIATSDGGELGTVGEEGGSRIRRVLNERLYTSRYESGSLTVFKDFDSRIRDAVGTIQDTVPTDQEKEALNRCLPGGDWG